MIFVLQTLKRSTRCLAFCFIRNTDTKHRQQYKAVTYKAVEEDPTYRHIVIADSSLEVSLQRKMCLFVRRSSERRASRGRDEHRNQPTVSVLIPDLVGCQVCTRLLSLNQ